MEGKVKKRMVLLVLSSTYDKALAAFMLANTALLMDMEVHMYFTFMGVGVIKKGFKPRLPGIFRFATGAYKKRMKKANVEDLDGQIAQAKKMGAKMYVCSACINAGLLKKEKIIPGVEIAGMGTLMDLVEDSDIHLVIG
ncbi:MAG: DsrE/DsrF/DrsH-like family protein [Methanomassiliicoccales archaeon]|nr:MAG: DsrE/DsrF/DrsH-like family protein [Methanomassiliicoccales archaeon]